MFSLVHLGMSSFFFFSPLGSKESHTHRKPSQTKLYNNPGDKLSHESTVCANRHKIVIFFAKVRRKKNLSELTLNDKIISSFFFFINLLNKTFDRTLPLKTPTKQRTGHCKKVDEAQRGEWGGGTVGEGLLPSKKRYLHLRIKFMKRTPNSWSGRNSQSQCSGSVRSSLNMRGFQRGSPLSRQCRRPSGRPHR